MKTYDRRNLVIRAWRIARVGGWRSLTDQAIQKWLPAIHTRFLSVCTSMEDVLRWVGRHTYYDVYSFDVFDTLLRRRIEPPEVIKHRVAEHISELMAHCEIYVSPEHVLAQRYEAEKGLLPVALSRGEDADYCLDDVITETLKALGADNVLDSEETINYEIGLEKKATEPMPGARAVLSYLRSRGKRVICISDSYLSPNQMGTILEHHGLLKYIDKLYVSSDAGKRKSTGKLFQHVIENEGSKMVHIGDNYTSDNIIPGRFGIRTLWFHSRGEEQRKSELIRLLNGENKMNYVNAVIRSADMDSTALHRIGYDVLGPALTVFVHIVAEQARKDDIEMIFFLARDGYVMKKIYEILRSDVCSNYSFPIGKYMCLGRLPVRLASVNKFTIAEVSEVYPYIQRFGGKDINFGDVLRSYGFEPGHFLGITKRYQIDIDEPIGDPARDMKLHELLGSNEFQKIIAVRSDEVRNLLREYLISIGFMGRRKVAIVDANAEGITQSLLDRTFLNDKDYPMVSRYFFNAVNLNYFNAANLNENMNSINLDLPQVSGIVSDWRSSPKDELGRLFIFGMLIELFSHPDHGVTVGYKNVNGKIMPIFRKTPQESQYYMTSQGLQGILSYARDYSSYYCLHNYSCKELLEPLKANIRQWMDFPPKKHGEALKDLFLISDWPKESSQCLLEQPTLRDIIRVRELVKKRKSAIWPGGTSTLEPVPGFNWLLRKSVIFKNQGRRLTSHLARHRHHP